MAKTFIDLIAKKRDCQVLSAAELQRLVMGISNGEMPDHQIGALLMAIYLNDLTAEETTALTLAMVDSGETIDLSSIGGYTVDKHSTGGVGDKVTLVLGPLIAAAGLKFPKLSGRGLGHTGGTLDKLESIPGMRVDLSIDELIQQVRRIGLAVTGQTQELVPADAVMYALRDQTGTVDSKPLIASSIMSKKLAAGADGIMLDVKCGHGAFMKSIEDAEELARQMVAIGTCAGKETRALVTSMDTPLGFAVGNALEVKESIETLSGLGPNDLVDEVLALGKEMMDMAAASGRLEPADMPWLEAEFGNPKHFLRELLTNGAAKQKLREMVEMQGGDVGAVDAPDRLPRARQIEVVESRAGGFIRSVDALAIGEIAADLGAGRRAKGDPVSASAGVVLRAKPGPESGRVVAGSPLLELHVPEEWDERVPLTELKRRAVEAFAIGSEPVMAASSVLARVAEGDS